MALIISQIKCILRDDFMSFKANKCVPRSIYVFNFND